MFRILFAAIAISLFMWGAWSILLSMQWPTKGKPDWKVTQGWITDVGGEYSLGMPGRMGKPFDFVITDQQVSYVFFIDGVMKFKRLELPPNVFPVRVSLKTMLPNFKPVDWDYPNAHLAPARYNPETNKLDVVTDPGYVAIVSGMTSRGLVQYKTAGKEEFDNYLNRINIRYNPKNPDESITDPDILDGASILQKSGFILLLLSIVLAAALKFHMSVTKEEEIPDPFANSGGQTYR